MSRACQKVTKRRENSPSTIPASPQRHCQGGTGLLINMIRVIDVAIRRPADNVTLQSPWQGLRKFCPFQSIQSGEPAVASRLTNIAAESMIAAAMRADRRNP